jgi:hypothetical protein
VSAYGKIYPAVTAAPEPTAPDLVQVPDEIGKNFAAAALHQLKEPVGQVHVLSTSANHASRIPAWLTFQRITSVFHLGSRR